MPYMCGYKDSTSTLQNKGLYLITSLYTEKWFYVEQAICFLLNMICTIVLCVSKIATTHVGVKST